MNIMMKCVLLGFFGVHMASCAYHGGERQKHEIRKSDGTIITCFEPPPEVVKKANVATDIEASAKEIGTLAKAMVRGEVTPERIREKLPSNVSAYEVIDFRLCVDYANGLYSPAEYRAFLDAKFGLYRAEQRKSPVKDGSSVDTVREHLMGFIEEGSGLVRELDVDPQKVAPVTKQKVSVWDAKVQDYLQNNLERSYLVRFKNFSDLPPPGIPSFPSYGDEWLGYRAAVMHRLTRLNQFLDSVH